MLGRDIDLAQMHKISKLHIFGWGLISLEEAKWNLSLVLVSKSANWILHKKKFTVGPIIHHNWGPSNKLDVNSLVVIAFHSLVLNNNRLRPRFYLARFCFMPLWNIKAKIANRTRVINLAQATNFSPRFFVLHWTSTPLPPLPNLPVQNQWSMQ